jgi:hypothetical protein
MKNTLVIIGGILSLLFGLFHLYLWKLLDWKKELIKLKQENSNVMQMLNIGTSVLLLSMGFVLLYFRTEVVFSSLGNAILIILALFYFIRLIMELVFPGRSIVFGFILLICVLIYLIPALIK